MEAKSPVAFGYEDKEIVIAKNQPEYLPLPALVTDSGIVITRWEPTEEERRAIYAGADVYVEQMTFGAKLQPMRVTIANKRDFIA